jgi:serine/threonine protein kinase/predicted ATPase
MSYPETFKNRRNCLYYSRVGGRASIGTTASESFVNRRYRVVKKLGEGGMGAVYLVADTLDEEHLLALKTIRADVVSPYRRRLFKNEFQAMTQFRHPNVIEVYDFGTVLADRYGSAGEFFTMEFVEGRSLLDACEDADDTTICGYAVQVCRALEYIHAQKFIHFDLKPENIMVRPEGGVKVMDFGVVGEQSFLQPRLLRGTVYYMAPEMIAGQPMDHRLDLYALGAVLFRVLAGRPLFDGAVEEVLEKHIHALPDLERDVRRPISAPLRTVLLRLLAKEPQQRYSSAGEVMAVLSRMAIANASKVATPSRAKDVPEAGVLGSRFVAREPEFARVKEIFHGRVIEPTADLPSLVLVSGPTGIGKTRLLSEFRHHVQLCGVSFVHGSCLQNGRHPYLPFAEILRTLVREILPSQSDAREGDLFAAGQGIPADVNSREISSLRGADYKATLMAVARTVNTGSASDAVMTRELPSGSDPAAAPMPPSNRRDAVSVFALRSEQQDVAARLLSEHAAALRRLLPEQAALHDMGSNAPHFERPDQEKQWLLGSVSRFLVELSRVRPMVLYTSDLHWADDLTVELLASVARSIRSASLDSGLRSDPVRLVLCGCLRDDDIGGTLLEKTAHELSEGHLAWRVPLQPLAAGDVMAMLHHMLGSVTLSAEVSSLLVERTAGNPFFIETAVRNLIEEGVAFRREATWVFDLARMRSDPVPTTVTEILGRTLAGVSANEARALELLAVFNRPVTSRLFREASRSAESETSQVLSRLRSKRFVERGWGEGHYQYSLRHAHLRDHIYNSIPAEPRARIHEIAGAAIERVHGDGERYREDLAEHFFRSSNHEKAVRYARLAADQARRMYDLKRAAALYTQAYEAATRLPDTAERRLLIIDLAVSIAENSYYSPSEKNIERLIHALGVAELTDDADRKARIWNWTGRTYYALGNQREAIRCFQEFSKLAEGTRDDLTRALPYAVLGRVHIFLGRFEEARHNLERAIGLLRGQPGCEEDLSYALGMCGSTMTYLGDFGRGRPLVEESIAVALSANHTTRVALGYVYLGIGYTVQGDWVMARHWLEKGIAITKQTGDIIGTGTGSSFLGLVHLAEGDAARALEFSRFGRDHIKAAGGTWTFTMIGAHLAEALAWTGDLDGALQEAKAALQIMTTGERWGESCLAVALGRVHARRGELDEARAWFQGAIKVGEQQQARPFVAKARLALGAFLRQIGEEGAVDELRLAEEAFRTLGMPWYLAKTRALLAGNLEVGPCP